MNLYTKPGADPREHAPELDDAVAEFLMQAIDRDAGRRFQTAAAFSAAIQKLPRQ